MNCSLCGTMIPDGQTHCPSCGAMAQSGMAQPVQPNMTQPVQPNMAQPVQPNMAQQVQPNMGQQMGGYQQPMGGYQQPMGGYQQPMGGYQQPMGGYQQPMGGYQQPMGGYQQPMGGYQQPMGGGADMQGFVNSLKADYMKLIGLIGALFIMLSPFFNWLSAKIKIDGDKEKEHANMFGLGDEIDAGIFVFFAILLLVIGVVLVLWDLADYVPALGSIKASVSRVPYIELILVAVALLVFILAMVNGDLGDAVKDGKESIEWAKDWYGDDEVSGYCNRGLGPIICIIGIVAAAVPKLKKSFKINITTK